MKMKRLWNKLLLYKEIKWKALRSRRGFAPGLAAALVAMVLLVPAVAWVASGNNAGVPVEKTYLLSATTGVSQGDGVMFFAVSYLDEDGNPLKEYILSSVDDMQRGYTLSDQLLSAGATAAAGETATAGQEATAGEGAAVNYLTVGRTDSNSVINLNENFNVSKERPLRQYTTDSFLFQTEKAISQIEAVEVFVRSGGTWTCQGLRVYQVNTLYGEQMYGYQSGHHYVDFSGTLLAEMEADGGFVNFNWDVDTAIQIRRGGTGLGSYRLNTDIPAEKAIYDSRANSGYLFDIKIKDTDGAGIESLATNVGNAKSLSSMGVFESLCLSLRYTDIYGDVRQVQLPVITSAVDWAIAQGADPEAPVLGVAQQGDRLCFAGLLPDCATVDAYTLYYGGESAMEKCNMVVPDGNPRIENQKTSRDSLAIDYVAVYSADSATAEAGITNGILSCKTSGEPLCYYAQAEETIAVGASAGHSFLSYDRGAQLTSENYANKYMVVLQSDDMSSAGTTADLSLKLNYMTVAGEERETSQYELRNMSKDFFGYWAGSNGNTSPEEIYYQAALRPGGELCFLITLNDVDYFTGATLSMGTTIDDDWQMKGLQIHKLSWLGPRSARWEPVQLSNTTTDRIIYRDYEGYMILNSQTTLLLQAGESKNVALKSGSVLVEPEVNWEDQRYTMSYEQSTQKLGFTKARNTYVVTADVADEAITNSGDGDCGSKNQFYFQLVFENGTSGYVLANQQLSADGFRSGYSETFNIATNQDYGELVSINIIPDDLSSTSDVFDKLKLDAIRVVQSTDTGLSKQWVIGNVGWITIDYRDEASMSTMTGTEGRSEAELVRSFPVSYSSYVVNLLFCMATALSDNGIQMQGSVTGNLCYYNGAGEMKTTTFDLVRAMYDYANKTPQYESSVDADGNISSSSNAISDKSWMFRENHMDRFTVSVDDIAQLAYLTIKVNSRTVSYFNIAGMSVSLIDSEGMLSLNSNDEYVRSNTTREIASHTSTYSPAYAMFCPLNTDEEVTIYFTDNEISVGEQDGGWTAAVSRTPSSTNDTLNLFVYPSEEGSPIEDYDIKATVQYSNLFGTMYQASVKELTRDSRQHMFYALGISATNMTTLNKVALQAVSMRGQMAFIDHAIVQQVRAGVVVATYYLDFGDGNIEYTQIREPSPATALPLEQQQVVIQLGQGMSAEKLVAENRDLAVALRYTTSVDERDSVYTSPYIYITDQGYASIAEGNLIRLNFNKAYVKEITGLTLVATGGLEIPIDGAYVATYEGDPEQGLRTCTGWYSMATKTVAGRTGETLSVTSKSLASNSTMNVLNMTFTTGASAGVVGVGNNYSVAVTVAYMDHDGRLRKLVVDDIRRHGASGAVANFSAGSSFTASVMLTGASQLQWISVEPYDKLADSIASWNLDNVSLSMENSQETFTASRSVQQQIYEGNALGINLSNVAIQATAKTYNSANGAYTQRTTINGDITLLAESGQKITIEPQITGSLSGYSVKAERVANGATADADSFLSKSGGTITFTPPKNISGNNVSYCVTITSEEAPGIAVTVNITVESDPVPVAAPERTEGGATGGTTTSTEGAATEGTTTTPEAPTTESTP